MKTSPLSPAELRTMFGRNLRILVNQYPSVSEVSRRLGINRTQLNRYLQGESFPRPDVLHKICAFFDVDARVLLEPVETLRAQAESYQNGPLEDFFEKGSQALSETDFPAGFYRFSRQSFMQDDCFIEGLVYVWRKHDQTFVRGYEAKAAMDLNYLPSTGDKREFRGTAALAEGGVAFIVSRRNATTCSFNFLTRVASFDGTFWTGYVSRTISEQPTGLRATRLVYEHLGRDRQKVFEAARNSGYKPASELRPFQQRLLQIGVPFR
jgi:transcriptional regulator with XRE-family HTH domain